MTNDTIKLSRLANRLLGDLEAIDNDTLTGDRNEPRKMGAVLECFEKVEQMVEERYADQLKRASAPASPNA